FRISGIGFEALCPLLFHPEFGSARRMYHKLPSCVVPLPVYIHPKARNDRRFSARRFATCTLRKLPYRRGIFFSRSSRDYHSFPRLANTSVFRPHSLR